jgi:DNA mismatch repair protein MutS
VAKQTPLMAQYQAIKSEYPGCLLFYRLGDFYELFGDDAKKAAKELDIVLTSRGTGNNQKTPMCGKQALAPRRRT